jgi:hypothetical protein
MRDEKNVAAEMAQRSIWTGIEHANGQKVMFFALLHDAETKGHLSNRVRSVVKGTGDETSIETPLGPVSIQFVPSATENYFCWSALFSEKDENGKVRDLYWIKLNWQYVWADSTGEPIKLDQWGDAATQLTIVSMVQRIIAAQFLAAQERLAKIS